MNKKSKERLHFFLQMEKMLREMNQEAVVEEIITQVVEALHVRTIASLS